MKQHLCVCLGVEWVACVCVCLPSPYRLYSHHIGYNIPGDSALHWGQSPTDEKWQEKNDSRDFPETAGGKKLWILIEYSVEILHKVPTWQMCVKRTINGGGEECLCCSVEVLFPSAWCEFNWSRIDYILFVINPKWVCIHRLSAPTVWPSCCSSKAFMALSTYSTFLSLRVDCLVFDIIDKMCQMET